SPEIRPLFWPLAGWYEEANPGAASRRFGSFVARAGFHWRFTPMAHLAAAEIATTGSGRRNDEILG
ncbi:MAG: hypothetical protein ACKO51_18420, partial [Alphaproteobacteria bacterium]